MRQDSTELKKKRDSLESRLQDRPELQKHLFEKGFLITDKAVADLAGYPFYGNWTVYEAGNYQILVHKGASYYSVEKNGAVYFLIGHAFNPFSMVWQEESILSSLAEKSVQQLDLEFVNQLTGIFIMGRIRERCISFWLDASGMQYGCYGEVEGIRYISSHMQLIGDLCGLKTDPYVDRLIHYRWYHYMMGNYMPGDITCFSELKRIVPNTVVHFDGSAFKVERFYPQKEISMCDCAEEYASVIAEACSIMQNTMALIPKKWARPAISLTGGIDSNTTFAAANGNYDKYTAFSYVSMYRESVDAEKAAQISKAFHVSHRVIQIPDTNGEISDYDLYRDILIHNDGDIGSFSDSDIRKKITLIQQDVCDVEVKSWISETIRAYAYKYFGKKRFAKSLKPRNYTSLYKIFFADRKLVAETDRHFKAYLENTDLKNHLFNYDETDFFVWEMMHGGKCGLDIGVMKSCFDITIPYNNRKLLDLLLRIPLEYRLSDQHHLDMKKKMNPALYEMNIRVVNLNETNTRKRLAGLYYSVNSFLPF